MTRPRRHVQELPEYRAPDTRVLDEYDALCRDCRSPRAVYYRAFTSGDFPCGQLRYLRGDGYAHACVERFAADDYRVSFTEHGLMSGPWRTEQDAAQYAAQASGLKLVPMTCDKRGGQHGNDSE